MKDIAIVFIIFGFVIGAPASCTVLKNQHKAEMIKAGGNPQVASCVYDFDPPREICSMLAAQVRQVKEKEESQ
jgi:hypothetical protein